MSLSPGATLGPYAIRAQLGAGGMGVVYTAHDPRLKRQVAIKLLTADLTRDETAKHWPVRPWAIPRHGSGSRWTVRSRLLVGRFGYLCPVGLPLGPAFQAFALPRCRYRV